MHYITLGHNAGDPLGFPLMCCVILDVLHEVCAPFMFDVLGRMRYLIVSVPDHCLLKVNMSIVCAHTVNATSFFRAGFYVTSSNVTRER